MSPSGDSKVSAVLQAAQAGDRQAAADLLPLVYDELRKLAAQKLAHETPGQTLQPTALVHEAYLRLVANPQGEPPEELPWDSRGHFFAAAAESMRRILVENARRKKRAKHGGGRQRVELEDVPAPPASDDDLLALDEALTRLAAEDPEAARVVQLRYFAGLSVEDAARSLGMSRPTAYRHWTFARVWLWNELAGGLA
jgi:RNA polymerase sigma factor (TIGR02999 family)